jgi:hypothetical protein
VRRWLLALILLGPILLLVGGTLGELVHRWRFGPVKPIPPAATLTGTTGDGTSRP